MALIPGEATGQPGLPSRRSAKKAARCFARGGDAAIKRPACGQTFQMSRAYCLMVRSEENLPAEAVFIRHLRAKPRGSAA